MGSQARKIRKSCFESDLRRIFFWVVILVVALHADLASAGAPQKININYDHAGEILHIDITHHTHDRNEHYIKKVVIYQNDAEPVVLHFKQQVKPVHFILDTPLKAEPGDSIRVEATDSRGGTKSEGIVVPEIETGEDTAANPSVETTR